MHSHSSKYNNLRQTAHPARGVHPIAVVHNRPIARAVAHNHLIVLAAHHPVRIRIRIIASNRAIQVGNSRIIRVNQIVKVAMTN